MRICSHVCELHCIFFLYAVFGSDLNLANAGLPVLIQLIQAQVNIKSIKTASLNFYSNIFKVVLVILSGKKLSVSTKVSTIWQVFRNKLAKAYPLWFSFSMLTYHCLLCPSGVDILSRLGLTAQSNADNPYERTSSPSTTHTTVSEYGVLLDSNSLYEAPADSLFPPEIGEELSVVVSLSSWRANNAFLFSVKDGRDRLRFGIQLLPRRVVVYTAEKAPIYFTYNWQDGRQHPFAIGIRARSVSFYADCGAVQQREQTLGRSQTLGDSGGLFTLGRMNSKAAPFNGRVCQLDIYPSAQAAAHYCKYLKTQCRLADTYRLPLPHPGLDIEANNPPSNSLAKSLVGVAATHHSPIKTTAAFKLSPGSLVTQYSTLSPSVQPHMGDQSHISTLDPLAHSTTSLLQPDGPTLTTLSGQAALDLSHSSTVTTMKNMLAKGSSPQGDTDHSENSTEEESSSGNLQNPDATTGLISPVRQSRVKEGLRNNSITSSRDSHFVPQQTHHLVETDLRANGTTLYRENQVDTSEQHDLDGSYDDIDMGGYDYGYEEPDFLYDYEYGFRGPKGEPGPMVSGWIYEWQAELWVFMEQCSSTWSRGKYKAIKANLWLLFECYVKCGFLPCTKDVCEDICAGRCCDLEVMTCPSTVLFSCINKLLK